MQAMTTDDLHGHLPSGYYMRDDGIYISDAAGQGFSWLCSPLRLVGEARTPQGGKWSLIIELLDRDDRWKLHVIPRELFVGALPKIIAPLLGAGLQLAPGTGAMKHLVTLLQTWRNEKLLLLVEQPGWTSREFTTFVLPDGTAIGDNDVIFARPGRASEASSEGSLADWRSSVGTLCNGNPLLMLGISLAFAGPLMEMLGEESGGVHLRATSAKGKSTIVRAASSVWGPPVGSEGWNATKNGLEAAAAAASGTLLAIDEIAEAPASELGNMLYLLGNGRGKLRMALSGSCARSARWHLPIISAGEVSAAEHMRTAGKHAQAGHEMRLLELGAEDRPYGAFDDLHGAGIPRDFAERLKTGYSSCYGTAGPAFVRFLIANRHKVVDYRSYIERFCALASDRYQVPAGDGQTQRALWRFALVALAGSLATRAGITGWTHHSALHAALEMFGAWLQRRARGASRPQQDGVAVTRDFLQEAAAGLQVVEAGLAAPVPAPLGWRDQDCFYVARDVWRKLHHRPDEAARDLEAQGLLKTNGGAGWQFRMPRSVLGRPWAYAVSVQILDERHAAARPSDAAGGGKAA